MKKLGVLFVIIALLIQGCVHMERPVGDGFILYYLNASENALEPVRYEPKSTGKTGARELLDNLSKVSTEQEQKAPLNDIGVEILSLREGVIQLDFGNEYHTLEKIKELLVRAAVVKTLCQMDEIDAVEMFVKAQPLTDQNNQEIGLQRAEDYVDYFANEQDNLLTEDFTLFFANEEGTSLIKEIHRVHFDSTLSKEQAVIFALQDEPNSPDAKPALSPNFSVSNMTTSDNICYVDIDSSMFETEEDILQMVSVYAIVNSLCLLKDVRAVQINVTVNDAAGNAEASSLTGLYEMNNDLVQNP